MLKKILISIGAVLLIIFTSCGGGSSDEAKELLYKILQFVGIPHSIIVNVCQDSNRDGICEAKELFTKLTIQEGENIEDILQKISLTAEGRYFLDNVDPNLPILVELQDEIKVNFDEGKFTLEFNTFENKEQNEIKEISILQSMVDANALTITEADKFRTLNNQEAQDKYYALLLNALETNINTLRANELDSQKAVKASIKEMADETTINQERADKINNCENNQTCVDEEIKKVVDELIITEDEVLEITDKKKLTQETNTTVTEPTFTPIKGEEVLYGKWVKPSQSVCEGNGGNYGVSSKYSVEENTKYEGSEYTDCSANWENSYTICSASGDVLPNIEILRTAVTSCGGVIDDYENNEKEAYQDCFRERGFAPNGYWSSTTNASDSSNAWYVYFDFGYDSLSSKMNESYVRCVRGGQ